MGNEAAEDGVDLSGAPDLDRRSRDAEAHAEPVKVAVVLCGQRGADGRGGAGRVDRDAARGVVRRLSRPAVAASLAAAVRASVS